MRFIAIPLSEILLCLFCSNKTVVFFNFPLAKGVKNKQFFFLVFTSQILMLAESNAHLEGGLDPAPGWVVHLWQAASGATCAPCQEENPRRGYGNKARPSLPFTITIVCHLSGHTASPAPPPPAARPLSDPQGS